MTEERKPSANPIESLLREHQDLVRAYLEKIEGIPSVIKVFALSTGDDIFITHVVESDDDRVWDKISAIEGHIINRFEQTTVFFNVIGKAVVDESRLLGREPEGPEGSVVVFEREISSS